MTSALGQGGSGSPGQPQIPTKLGTGLRIADERGLSFEYLSHDT